MSQNVGNVAATSATQNYYANLNNNQPANPNAATAAATAANTGDTFVSSTQEANPVNTTYSRDAVLNRMWAEAESAHAALRNIVEQMLSNGETQRGQAFWWAAANPDQSGVTVDEATRLEAEAMIADDGFFGVEQTTQRIMDFAFALAGGREGADQATIENLRGAAQQAFDSVAHMFGGFNNLPDVTQRTHEAVMQAFDNWRDDVTAPV